MSTAPWGRGGVSPWGASGGGGSGAAVARSFSSLSILPFFCLHLGSRRSDARMTAHSEIRARPPTGGSSGAPVGGGASSARQGRRTSRGRQWGEPGCEAGLRPQPTRRMRRFGPHPNPSAASPRRTARRGGLGVGYRGWFPPSQPPKETHRDSASVGLVLSAPFCTVQTSLRESTCSAHVVEVGRRGFQGSPVDNCPFVGGSAPPIRGSVGRPPNHYNQNLSGGEANGLACPALESSGWRGYGQRCDNRHVRMAVPFLSPPLHPPRANQSRGVCPAAPCWPTGPNPPARVRAPLTAGGAVRGGPVIGGAPGWGRAARRVPT